MLLLSYDGLFNIHKSLHARSDSTLLPCLFMLPPLAFVKDYEGKLLRGTIDLAQSTTSPKPGTAQFEVKKGGWSHQWHSWMT